VRLLTIAGRIDIRRVAGEEEPMQERRIGLPAADINLRWEEEGKPAGSRDSLNIVVV
jgi:hypothetical protein